MANRKLGKPTDQRVAMLRNLTTALIWNGKIVTTETRAKEVRSIAEKIITLAVKEYKNTEKRSTTRRVRSPRRRSPRIVLPSSMRAVRS